MGVELTNNTHERKIIYDAISIRSDSNGNPPPETEEEWAMVPRSPPRPTRRESFNLAGTSSNRAETPSDPDIVVVGAVPAPVTVVDSVPSSAERAKALEERRRVIARMEDEKRKIQEEIKQLECEKRKEEREQRHREKAAREKRSGKGEKRRRDRDDSRKRSRRH